LSAIYNRFQDRVNAVGLLNGIAQNQLIMFQTFIGRAGLVISTISTLHPLLLAIYSKLPDHTISVGLFRGIAQNQVKRAQVCNGRAGFVISITSRALDLHVI